MCRVYMFCLLEMKDGVNQRTFFGNKAWVRFKVMQRDEENTLEDLKPWWRCVFLYQNWSPPWSEVESMTNNLCVSVDVEEGCSVNSDWNVWRPLVSKFRCVAERYFSHVNTLIHVDVSAFGICSRSPDLFISVWIHFNSKNTEFNFKITVFFSTQRLFFKFAILILVPGFWW